MIGQGLLPHERFATFRALEWLCQRMRRAVYGQIGLASVALIAFITMEWSADILVVTDRVLDHQMVAQSAGAREHFRTDDAFMRKEADMPSRGKRLTLPSGHSLRFWNGFCRNTSLFIRLKEINVAAWHGSALEKQQKSNCSC